MRRSNPVRRVSTRHMSHKRHGRGASWIATSPACAKATAWLLAMTGLLLASSLLPAFAASAPPEIDDRFCEALVKHTPDADVAYQAGVDVDGNAVVPADLEGTNNFALPDEITIPLTADLMTFLKMDASALPASAMGRNDIPLGSLTLRGDQVLFNDQPLTNTQQDNLAVLCLKPTK